MALGDAGSYITSNGNNNSKKVYDSTYYSRIRLKNKEKLAMEFNFNFGLLKIIISTEKDNYRYEKLIEISISPTKAKLLIKKLEDFIARMKSGEQIDPNTGVGISTGVKETTSYIVFKTTGNDPDIPEHECVIGKVSPNGDIIDARNFVFNTNYDYSLNFTDVLNVDAVQEYDQFMGIQTVLDVLKEFAMSSSGAIGASVWDTGRYEVNRILKSIDPIYEKLGIEKKKNSNNSNYFDRQVANNDPFSNYMNAPQGHSEKKTMEDLEDMLT